MYGRKRIVVSNNGSVTLTGGKSHFHIGKYVVDGDKLTARVLRPEHKFEHRLTDENSVTVAAANKSELRAIVAQMWATEVRQ